jgi:thioredoxin reductase
MIYDAIIVGGGYAGLSAASMLARARRDILVVDAGCGRNRFASHAHGVLALDGEPGADIVARASAQLADYSSAEQTRGSVASIDGHDRAFLVRTEDGRAFASRKILLATGVTDLLP